MPYPGIKHATCSLQLTALNSHLAIAKHDKLTFNIGCTTLSLKRRVTVTVSAKSTPSAATPAN